MAKRQIVYVGAGEGRVIPGVRTPALPGVPVEVSAGLAERLLEQSDVWAPADSAPKAKAKAKAADPAPEEGDDR